MRSASEGGGPQSVEAILAHYPRGPRAWVEANPHKVSITLLSNAFAGGCIDVLGRKSF